MKGAFRRGLMLACALLSMLVLPDRQIEAGGPLERRAIGDTAPVPRPDRAIEPQELETFIDGVIAAQFAAHRLAGAAVILVQDGRVTFRKGYGHADVERRIRTDPGTTRFTVGSISKLIVWTAVMQQVERGALDLDADINDYLTRFRTDNRFQRPVTLRHLLTHTAGFEEIGTPFAPAIARRHDSLGDFLAAHLPARVLPPASDFASASMPYSNWGALLAAHVVEAATGKPFDLYAARNIFAPLGMASSRFQSGPATGGPGRALGYAFENGAMRGRLEDMTPSGPAGALITTADDVARFMIAHLDGGAAGEGRILAPRTTAFMHRRHAQSSPYLDGMALGFMESSLNGRRALRHDGSTQLTHSELLLLPDQEVGLFVTYNSHDGGYARREIIKAFVDRYFPADLPALRPGVRPDGELSTYAGYYRSLRRSFTTYEKLFGAFPLSVEALPNGRLLAAGAEWQKVAPDTFRSDAGELLGFNRDADGAVASLSLRSSLVPAVRIGWHEHPLVHLPVLLLALLWGLASMLVAPRRGAERALPRPLRWTGWLVATVGALNTLSLLALAISFAGGLPSIMNHGPPPLLHAGLSLALGSLAVTAAAAPIVGLMIWKGHGSRRRRLFYAAAILVSALYLVILSYWNLLGFHIG